jgi:pSer/pThr/pTyr-binding forkhead associated (FHA) protein
MASLRESTALAILVARWVGGASDTIPLTRSPIRVGRSEQNDIIVNHGPISGRHVELAFVRGAWEVCDLGSSNGTVLQDRRLAANAPTHLLYHSAVCLASVLELCLLPPSRSTWGIQTPRHVHFVTHLRPGLVVLQRSGEMQRALLSKPRTIMGRSSSSDIVIDDAQVSGQHAQVVAQGQDQFQIVDLGSTNGLVHNGQRIQQKTLARGDRFTIGDQVVIEYQPALGFVTHVSGLRQRQLDRTLYSRNRLRTCAGCGALNYGPHTACLLCNAPPR